MVELELEGIQTLLRVRSDPQLDVKKRSLESELNKIKLHLKKLQGGANRQQEYRKRKKILNPTSRAVGRPPLEEAQPLLRETLLRIVNVAECAADFRRRSEMTMVQMKHLKMTKRLQMILFYFAKQTWMYWFATPRLHTTPPITSLRDEWLLYQNNYLVLC